MAKTYRAKNRREDILLELEEYRHDSFRIRRKGTGYRSSPVEILAEEREELEEELARVETEIQEIENQEGIQ